MSKDQVRQVAFDRVYQLPGAVDRTAPPETDAQTMLDEMAPDERTMAFQIAARRLAFQLMYEMDVGLTNDAGAMKSLEQVEGLGPIAIQEVASMVQGAYQNRASADREFAALAPEWPTHRQAAVDRAILRLAHHEMSAGRTPTPIIVNEAVELAKHYSTDRAPAFINALLDKVLKRLDAQGQAGAAGTP